MARRDHQTKNASVIGGLRLEADVAQRLCEAARTHAADKHGRGDVAQMARYYVRTGLGYTAEASNTLEDKAPKPERLCGLTLEKDVMVRLRASGANVSAVARHFIRRGLGFSDAESRRREEKFAALAEALREIREAHE